MKSYLKLFLISMTMMAVVACGSSAPFMTPTASSGQITATVNGTVVDVTLADNTIKSSLTTFRAGVPYTFVIQNSGTHAHNFNIAQPVAIAGSLDAALANALLAVTRDQLQAGESVTVEYTFPDSAVGQQLEFSCLIRMHYEDGMYLAITVTN